MYNVTLQNKNGDVFTCRPACYGFMKRGTASTGDYRFNRGWTLGTDGQYSDMAPANRVVPFDQLEFIWNTGTHLNQASQHENPNFVRTQPVSASNPRLISSVTEQTIAAARFGQVGGINTFDGILQGMRQYNVTIPEGWDYIEELKTIEAYFDDGRDSIIRRHPSNSQIFGVYVGENIPADRALNYLMLARAFTTERDNTNTYVWLRYIKGLNPAQAAILARFMSLSENWDGNISAIITANYGDGCIYPGYMIAKGIGALYASPRAVNWVQPCYSDMNRATGAGNTTVTAGHLRDSLMPRTTVFSLDENINRESYGAMFQAIFMHPVMRMGWETLANAVLKTKPGYSALRARMTNMRDVSASTSGQISCSLHYYDSSVTNLSMSEVDAVIELFNTPVSQPA